MTSNTDEELRGIEMTPSDIDEFLVEQGHGTFSVASEGRAYAVPISFGYDDERLYLSLLTFGNDSKKLAYLEDTDEASLLAVDVESRYDWRSVVVTGTISEVDEDETEYHEEVLEENGWFPLIAPPSAPLTDVKRVVLEPATMSGYHGRG